MVHLFYFRKGLGEWTLRDCLLINHLMHDLVQLVSEIAVLIFILILCNAKS